MRRLVCLAAAVLALGVTPRADADNLLGGTIASTPVNDSTVDFTVELVLRRSVSFCVDPTTLTATACSGADGLPAVGDVVPEFRHGTRFSPGDGTLIGSPVGGLMLLVTDVDADADWLQGVALDPTRLPALVPVLEHTYLAAGAYVAAVNNCCRMPTSPLGGDAEHINDGGGLFRTETLVTVGGTNESPIATLAPIQHCPEDGLCTFTVDAMDPEGAPLTYRLATSAEAGGASGFVQPGPSDAPNAATIDPATGVYSWDTTGATLASPGKRTLYSTQVVVEDGTTRVPVDFFVELQPCSALPPQIALQVDGAALPCGDTLFAVPGDSLSVQVSASDPDAGDVVTLKATGVEASMALALPVDGNPAQATLQWAPTSDDVGVHSVEFTAHDTFGCHVATCTLNIEVLAPVDDPSVALDIEPGACPNKLQTVPRGMVPVAILGTASFDVADIDASTVLLENVAPVRTDYADVATPYVPFDGKSEPTDCTDAGPDGHTDLALTFSRADLVEALGETVNGEVRVLRLTGNLLDGTPIAGEDVVVIHSKPQWSASVWQAKAAHGRGNHGLR